MRKYEFTGETKKFGGITLHRIRATRNIERYNVKAGDVGGWLESEKNLSQDDDAWVSGDACVYGDARVSGNARVYDNAWVSGNARVYDNAWVSGDACVYGDARVSGNARVSDDARVYDDAWVYGDARDKSPLQIQGTKYMFYAASKNKIGIGCQIHTYAAWHKCWRKVADEHNFTVDEQREYIMYFNLACELYGKQKYMVAAPVKEYQEG